MFSLGSGLLVAFPKASGHIECPFWMGRFFSIGCYMVPGIHIALGGFGVWETKHRLPAGIDTYSIAGWAETITGLSGVHIRRDEHLL